MRRPKSVESLDALGRVRLSRNFYMREFLYSEIAAVYGIANVPDDPDLAIYVGTQLCEQLLEPLSSTFGRIVLRSSYRSIAVNDLGVGRHNCAKSESNFAGHIWDRRDHEGGRGATACIAIPWFTDRYANGADWRSLAYWIHDHLPYSELEFFDGAGMCTLNLSWHEKPKKTVTSYIGKKQTLLKNAYTAGGFSEWYADFPVRVYENQ